MGIYPAYALTDGADGHNAHGGNEDADILVPEFTFDLDTAPMLLIHGDADGYASMASVKVYMSKLRGLLADVGDIRIQNQNKLWSIAFEGDTQCDYLEALRLFREGTGEEDVDRLLELLLKGQMLPNTELDWIDEYKSAFSNATIDFLCRQLRREDLTDKAILQAANTIFQHDFTSRVGSR